MRDRSDADVHVLVTTQDTGGGGTEYTLKFIGLGSFVGVEQTLRYSAPPTATLRQHVGVRLPSCRSNADDRDADGLVDTG